MQKFGILKEVHTCMLSCQHQWCLLESQWVNINIWYTEELQQPVLQWEAVAVLCQL